MELTCVRKAGKGASGVRAADVIGECNLALVSISLTIIDSGRCLVKPRNRFADVTQRNEIQSTTVEGNTQSFANKPNQNLRARRLHHALEV